MTKRARCIVVEHNRELSKTQPITHPACASCTSTRHTRKLPERSAGKLVPLFVDQPSHAGSVKRACVLLPGVRCSDGIRDRAQGRCAHFVLQHTSARRRRSKRVGARRRRSKRVVRLQREATHRFCFYWKAPLVPRQPAVTIQRSSSGHHRHSYTGAAAERKCALSASTSQRRRPP